MCSPPEHVLQRRVYFVNNEKSKFVAVGFHPSHNYEECVQIAGTRRTGVTTLWIPYVNSGSTLTKIAWKYVKVC
jgi:hypothetical protein